ncbi:Uncharacterised protein [Vibrio cholerae]|nr:Uncharacterised protein [Vibrio cholerae]
MIDTRIHSHHRTFKLHVWPRFATALHLHALA